MNAAVRAVVRTALHHGASPFAVYAGYLGLVDGGPAPQPVRSRDGGRILQGGGTMIGTARNQAFRTREGRRQAAYNLLRRHIDRLVVIGGDGSLLGAELFHREWPELLAELVAERRIDQDLADLHPALGLV